MQVMTRTKEFEIWKVQAATLVAIPEAAIRGAAIPGAVGIPGVATRVEGILEGAVGEVILRAEAEDPTGDEELPRKALKTTRKCSR
jgi:hypothetical protein